MKITSLSQLHVGDVIRLLTYMNDVTRGDITTARVSAINPDRVYIVLLDVRPDLTTFFSLTSLIRRGAVIVSWCLCPKRRPS